MNEDKELESYIDDLVKKINSNAKHQQDLVQSMYGICRCIPAGTHGSTPHLLKTVIVEEDKK